MPTYTPFAWPDLGIVVEVFAEIIRYHLSKDAIAGEEIGIVPELDGRLRPI